MALFKTRLRIRRLFSWLILFSFACGPGPLDFEEFFTLFDPETSERPAATDYYFFTHNYLSFSSETPNSAQLADSLNLETWVNYTNGKISKEEFRKGLFEPDGGPKLAQKLKAIGKKEAAEYVTLAQKIDKETEKYGSYWQPAEPVNEQLVADYREIALQNIQASNEDFMKERYVFQIMKIDAKLNEYGMLLDDHHSLSSKYKTRTFISEWIQARVAGAHLAKGDTARGVLEFARVFETSPTRRNQADLSVRRLNSPHFDEALKLAETDTDKMALYALQAIQPYEDGLLFMKKIAAIDPNNSLLELIMTREINKNEVNFYSDRNSGLYGWNMEVYDENYKTDSAKLTRVKEKAASYFDQLKAFAQTQANPKIVKNPDFWYASVAYLAFIDSDYKSMKENIDRVSSSKPGIRKEVRFLELLHEMENGNFAEQEAGILDKLALYKPADNFRDNNLLVFLSEKLEGKYSGNTSKKSSGGLLSSCKSQNPGTGDEKNTIRAFLAKAYGASDYDYTYETGLTKPGMLEKAEAGDLKNLIAFITNPETTANDKKLIQLAALDLNATRLAYARKLVKTQEYELALEVFNQMPDSTLHSDPFLTYFSPIPRQYVGLGTPDESLLSPKTYFEKVVSYKKDTEKEPKNALAWYNLGLAAYNMSYWGNGWLFSERYWSSAEIGYGNPSSTDYFTNSYARMCFEKALAAKPDTDLGARICYMGALCERNEYYIAYALDQPTSYNQEELDAYHIKMENTVKPGYQKFFKRLRDEYNQSAYEKEVIKECITYANYKAK